MTPTEPNMETDTDKIEYRATELIPISIAVMLLLIPVLILQATNHEPPRNRRAKHTKWLMLCVMASNTFQQFSFYFEWFLCRYCRVSGAGWGCSRAIVKGFNLTFLLHRAKLAQGMAPVLSRKWFEKILPTFIWLAISGFVFSIIEVETRMQYICIQYTDWNAIDHCVVWNEASAKGIAIFAIGLDGAITLGLMTLFITPLYRVYHLDLGVMNDNQLKQRRKLKTLLIWSVALTLINQVTSTLMLIRLVHESEFTKILWMIGLFDPPINVWTSWLMVTRNRRALRRMYISCRRQCRRRDMDGVIAIVSPPSATSASASSVISDKSTRTAKSIILVEHPPLRKMDTLELDLYKMPSADAL